MRSNGIRFLDEGWLKVAGLVLMTVDHIAMFLLDSNSAAYTIMRSIGRLAMPIFIFMAIEGVYHTKNYRNYFLRLFVLGLAIDGVLALTNPEFLGNMMIDLALGTLVIYLLRRRDRYSFLAVLPAAYLVLSDFPLTLNGRQLINSDYGTFGLIIFLGFFIAYEAAGRLCLNRARALGIDTEIYQAENLRPLKNSLSAFALIAVVCVFYALYRINYELPILPAAVGMESWCVLAFPFFLVYSGRRGYDRPWFRYGAYLYYPLHILVLVLIGTWTA